MSADATPRRYPLLPPGSGLGWTPYAWLIYLGSYLWRPMVGDVAPMEIAASFVIAAVFVPLYFWGYWQNGRRIVWPALGMAVLGTIGAFWNPMAAVFFIFGAGYVGGAASARLGMAVLGGLLAWIAAVSILLSPHASFWLVGSVFTLLIGGINLHFGQMAKKNAKLRRSQEEVEHLAQVAERERIGRDLHDLLGHTLSLITLKSELAGKLLGPDPEAAAREVADIERISRRALSEVRDAVRGYRESGLSAELARAARALADAGVECDSRVEPAALAAAHSHPEVERALAFVLREAVTNVIRHAAAERCELSLAGGPAEAVPGTRGGLGAGTAGGETSAGEDGELVLEVTDDGTGGDSPDGYGLSGMRYRVAALGGRLERHGDGGTRLSARVPLRAAVPGAGAAGEAAAGTEPPAAAAEATLPPPPTPAVDPGDRR